MNKVIFWFCITAQILIWPLGLYEMFEVGTDPDKVGRAMASLIIIFAMPLFLIRGR